MPNPFGPKPGPLGNNPVAEAKYYDRYFDGKQLHQDRSAVIGKRGEETPVAEALGVGGPGEEMKDAGRPRPQRVRISPKAFWYREDHVTPTPPAVAEMNSRELKFA